MHAFLCDHSNISTETINNSRMAVGELFNSFLYKILVDSSEISTLCSMVQYALSISWPAPCCSTTLTHQSITFEDANHMVNTYLCFPDNGPFSWSHPLDDRAWTLPSTVLAFSVLLSYHPQILLQKNRHCLHFLLIPLSQAWIRNSFGDHLCWPSLLSCVEQSKVRAVI